MLIFAIHALRLHAVAAKYPFRREMCICVQKEKKTATAKHNYSNDIFFLLFPHKNFLSCVRKPEIDLFIENGGYIRV